MKKIFPLASIFLLMIVAQSFNIVQQTGADQRVKVDFYFESLCPYCQQYIVGSLKVAANTADFWKICDFNMYPYGNARRVQNGSSWSFTCQHGVRQCEGNFIESCIIKKYDFYTQGLPMIICLQSNSSDWNAQGKKCATQYGIDWASIQTCATGAQGVQYEVEMAQATQKLNPAHTYVPWVVVNNQHTSSAQNSVISNMVRYVCSIYRGPQKIKACN